MPLNAIKSSKRAIAAIASVMIGAFSVGGVYHVNRANEQVPAAVVLAVDHLIKPWEGLVLEAHWDKYAKIWDICYGETRINGKPVTAGMKFTKAECDELLNKRVYQDYYLPLTKQVPGFTKFPVSVQATQISGAYNFGVGSFSKRTGMAGSSAVRFAIKGQFRAACEAQTAFNKAGGQVVTGLVRRREMGDAQRIGEAELCVSGLK